MTRSRRRPKRQMHSAERNSSALSPIAQHPRHIGQGQSSKTPQHVQPPEPQTLIRYEELHLFVGPLPPPDQLAAYKAIQDDYPERLMRLLERQTDMAEVQATHRQKLETKVVYGGATRSWAGLSIGGVIILAAIFCGTYLIAHGEQVTGLAAIIVALGGLISIYVYGVRQQQGQLAQRGEAVPETPPRQ